MSPTRRAVTLLTRATSTALTAGVVLALPLSALSQPASDRTVRLGPADPSPVPGVTRALPPQQPTPRPEPRPTPEPAPEPRATTPVVPVEPEVRDFAVEQTVAVQRSGEQVTAPEHDHAHGDDDGEDQPQHEAEPVELVTEPYPASGFAVVGATWAGETPEGLHLELRSRTGDEPWTQWLELHQADNPGDAESPDARLGTDAMAVGEVDAVQVRITSPSGELPDDLDVSVIDPGETITTAAAPAETAPRTRQTEELRHVAARTAVMATSGVSAPKPRIHSRAEWGANERMRDGSPRYGTIKGGFVHHTVNANGYSRADVPAILRGIYAYHTQSRGWSDIGYNFLVDRFGRIWEGRYGGVARPVIGAHTLGYNHVSFAMSAIGNFETANPSSAMVDAYGRLFAWKLGLHGISASSRVTMEGRRFYAVSGHRDAGSTACPGRYLYAKLPTIRTKASGYQTGATSPSPSPTPTPSPTPSPSPTPTLPPAEPGPAVARDVDGDGRHDLLGRNPSTGALQMLAGTQGPGFGGPQPVGFDGSVHDLFAGTPDLNGDGVADLLTRVRRTGVTQVRPGRADGTFGRPLAGSHQRFAVADLIAGAGNLSGNRHHDVLMRDRRNDRLWVYHGKGDGTLGVRRLLLPDAGNLRAVAGVGDLDGDGRDDLMAVSGSNLLLYRGLGRADLAAPVVVHKGWGSRDLTVAGVDVTGDGDTNLVALDRRTGRTWIYALEPSGRPGPRMGGWKGWAGYTAMTAVGDLGTGKARLVARSSAGALVTLESRQTDWYAETATGTSSSAADFVQLVGDWNGDGHPDVVTRSGSTGNMWLYRGDGRSGFAKPTRLAADWSAKSDLVAVGDLSGDERPDLLARDRDGRVFLYPSDGGTGIGPRRLASADLFDVDQVTPVGYWNGDRVRDLVVRRSSDKALFLVPGTGSGTLGTPVRLRDGFGSYDQVTGVGDVTGDGRPDLVARTPSNGRVWLFAGQPERLGARTWRATDLRRFDLIG